MKARLLLLICLWPSLSMAAAGGASESASSPELSVEERLQLLDTDHDGQVSMSEIRVFLENKHGKGYESSLLGEMERKGNPSCGSPFSRSLY